MQKYSRMKLYAGIYGATISSKTPDREAWIDKITREIERGILARRQKQITSQEIGDITLSVLRKMDARTFLRYLAYSKDIKNETDMIREFNRYSR